MPRWPASVAVLFAPAFALAAGSLGLWLLPDLRLGLFAGGAARLAALLQPGSVWRAAEGWQIGPADADRPVLVTEACAATDFFLLVAMLLAWRFAAGASRPATTRRAVKIAALALLAALPLTLAINALRIVAVVAAHVWWIPRLPESRADFAHQLVGVAVFLPALVLLDLVLVYHVRRSRLDPSLAHA